MARPLRIQYTGAVYHVSSRGNGRQAIYHDEEDRIIFLQILKTTIKRYSWLCHGYCLMDNHYHLLIETPDSNLSRGMRQLNGVYTQAYNKKYQQSGHLLQGRYKAIVIQKESHLLEVSRYIILNPVRAKIVKDPKGWDWSSYRAMIGQTRTPKFLTRDWILKQFAPSRPEAQKRYQVFVLEGRDQDSPWKGVKGQSLLGTEDFVNTLAKYIREKEEIKEIPRKQRYIAQPSLKEIFAQGKDWKQLILLAIEEHGYSQREIADHLGIHYASVSRILKRLSEQG